MLCDVLLYVFVHVAFKLTTTHNTTKTTTTATTTTTQQQNNKQQKLKSLIFKYPAIHIKKHNILINQNIKQ